MPNRIRIYFFLLLFIRKKILEIHCFRWYLGVRFSFVLWKQPCYMPHAYQVLPVLHWEASGPWWSSAIVLWTVLEALRLTLHCYLLTYPCLYVCLTFFPAVSLTLWGLLGWVSAAWKWETVNNLGVTFNPHRMELVDICFCLPFSRVWDKVLGVGGLFGRRYQDQEWKREWKWEGEKNSVRLHLKITLLWAVWTGLCQGFLLEGIGNALCLWQAKAYIH